LKIIGEAFRFSCIFETGKYAMTPILPGAPWLIAHRSMLGVNKPCKVTLNTQDYVLWQNPQGQIFALENICPHMQAPLSEGWICESHNAIACPFHAIEFDGTGRMLKDGKMTQSISKEMGQSNEISSPTQLMEEVEEIQDELEQSPEDDKVETTAEELEAFEKVKAIVARSTTCALEVKYKDVVSYFGLNVGKVTWWFLRLYLSPKKKSFVTRLPIEEVKKLSLGFEVQEMSASFGDATARVIISSINDLDILSDLILKCYESEVSKRMFGKTIIS
jgi:nitrite reductase/ring-hydroxylating ferredoxin subunit